jgi:hypothetical protein
MTPPVHQFVAEFNWDDDLSPIAEIIADRKTDFAIALMIYWRLDGPWCNSDAPCNAAAGRLNAEVRSKLLDGFYQNRVLSYDPVADNGLTKSQVAKLRRAGTPSILLDAV